MCTSGASSILPPNRLWVPVPWGGMAGLWVGTGALPWLQALEPSPSLKRTGLCPHSEELSPDNEGALHTSFHQLIQEQSSLMEAGLELEMQNRSRGKASWPQSGWDRDSVCAWTGCGQRMCRSLLTIRQCRQHDRAALGDMETGPGEGGVPEGAHTGAGAWL